MKTFTLGEDIYNEIQTLKKDKEKASVILAICEFMFDNKEPKKLSKQAKKVFEFARPTLQKSKNNSGRGGRPKKPIKTDLCDKKTDFNEIKTDFQEKKPIENRFENGFFEKEEFSPNEKERTKEKEIPFLQEKDTLRKKERKEDIYIITSNPCACDSEKKSHEDIMREYNLDEMVSEKLKAFLRQCYLNKHIVSNEKLDDICFRLVDTFNSRSEMIDCIDRAISGGYFDIRA